MKGPLPISGDGSVRSLDAYPAGRERQRLQVRVKQTEKHEGRCAHKDQEPPSNAKRAGVGVCVSTAPLLSARRTSGGRGALGPGGGDKRTGATGGGREAGISEG